MRSGPKPLRNLISDYDQRKFVCQRERTKAKKALKSVT